MKRNLKQNQKLNMSNISGKIENFKNDISNMRKEVKDIREVLVHQNACILSLLSGTPVPKEEPESDSPDVSDDSNISSNFEKLNQVKISINAESNTHFLPAGKKSNDPPQHCETKLKYFPQSAKTKCTGCEELSRQLDLYEEAAEKRYNTLLEILAEHKILLDSIAKQNAVVTDLKEYFPINTVEKLQEFDVILATNPDPYLRQMKSILSGNAESNLHEVFGQSIILNFNVDGTFGKKRLRDFPNVFRAIMDVISTFSKFSDKTLRAAFQRQKKKYFKQQGRHKAKANENLVLEAESSSKED